MKLPLPARPAVPCRIVKLLEYDVGGGGPHDYYENALCRFDNGEEFFIFCPELERRFMGRRCLLQLNAFLAKVESRSARHTGLLSSAGPTLAEQRFAGKVIGYFLDGVLLDLGFGSIGVSEIIDDRVETGQSIAVSTGRLDFRRVLATESLDGRQWESVHPDPFEDPAPALAALRAGEAEARPMTADVMEFVEGELKVIDETPYSYRTLWGHPVESLAYRFGETNFREAEGEVVEFLSADDVRLRDAAVWVLTRHWGVSQHTERIMKLAFESGAGTSVTEPVKAIVGLGILLRGTGDERVASELIGILRDRCRRWFIREASYLALLGICLPETAQARDWWRSWDPWGEKKGSVENLDEAWDEEWGKRNVDWELVAQLEKRSLR